MPSSTYAVKPARRVSRWSKFWMVLGLFCWAGLGLWFAFPPPQAFVEGFYTRFVYRVIVAGVAPLTNSADFSVALALTIALVAGFPLLWTLNWLYLRFVKGRSHWRGLFWGFQWAFFLTPIIAIWFLVFWGAGYQRLAPEERLKLDTSAITDEESALLRGQLLETILNDQPQAPEDRDANRALAAVAAAMKTTIKEWDGHSLWLPDGVKATPEGLLLANGTSGICTPFTLEPHVDGGLPDTAFVSTGAHELGHIAGMCTEAEATLIGFVSGVRAADPYARYAVALDMYMDLVRQLPGDAMKSAMERLPEIAREDLKKAREAAARYRIEWLQKASWRAYDKYLQAQGIKEGVKNYGRGISLFLFLWRDGRLADTGLTPPVPALPEPAEGAAPSPPEAGPSLNSPAQPVPEAGASPDAPET